MAPTRADPDWRLAMRETLIEHLNAKRPSSSAVAEAMRYLVAEWSGDRTPEQLGEDLAIAAGDTQSLADTLDGLGRDGELLDVLHLLILDRAWGDEEGREQVAGALEDARDSLPVADITPLAVVALFALRTVISRGRRRTIRIYERLPDGTFRSIETTEYESTGKLGSITEELRRIDEQAESLDIPPAKRRP